MTSKRPITKHQIEFLSYDLNYQSRRLSEIFDDLMTIEFKLIQDIKKNYVEQLKKLAESIRRMDNAMIERILSPEEHVFDKKKYR